MAGEKHERHKRINNKLPQRTQRAQRNTIDKKIEERRGGVSKKYHPDLFRLLRLSRGSPS